MKLYWRHKRNGKWTWTAAVVYAHNANSTCVENRKEEEDDPSEDYCRAVEEE